MTTIKNLEFSCSREFTTWMKETRVSLAVSTGDTGKVLLVGLDENDELSVFERSFDRAGGLYADASGLLVATRFQIWRLANVLTEGPTADGYDALLVPQAGWVTGAVQAGDIAVLNDGNVVFANTMFSCAAGVSIEYSFAPVWRPPFITRVVPEQRCMLNGLATDGEQVRYATLAAQTDEPRGWRDFQVGGGAVFDTVTNQPVALGLTLPAAPRLYHGDLWLMESGSGYFGRIDRKTGRFERMILCPGLVRGLDFYDGYAVTTTSKKMAGIDVGSLPLGETLSRTKAEARCAVVVMDLAVGTMLHWLRIEGPVAELQDVVIMPGVVRPAAIGLEGPEVQRILSIAPEPETA